MKKKIVLTLFIGIFTIVASVSSAYFLINRKGGEVSMSFGGRKAFAGKLETKTLTLFPGSTKTYSVQIECNETGNYLFAFDVTERKDGGLKPFVSAKLYFEDELIASGMVQELLAAEPIEVSHAFYEGDEVEVKVEYSMDVSVTDEAQGTSASFDVVFTANKIEE